MVEISSHVRHKINSDKKKIPTPSELTSCTYH